MPPPPVFESIYESLLSATSEVVDYVSDVGTLGIEYVSGIKETIVGKRTNDAHSCNKITEISKPDICIKEFEPTTVQMCLTVDENTNECVEVPCNPFPTDHVAEICEPIAEPCECDPQPCNPAGWAPPAYPGAEYFNPQFYENDPTSYPSDNLQDYCITPQETPQIFEYSFPETPIECCQTEPKCSSETSDQCSESEPPVVACPDPSLDCESSSNVPICLPKENSCFYVAQSLMDPPSECLKSKSVSEALDPSTPAEKVEPPLSSTFVKTCALSAPNPLPPLEPCFPTFVKTCAPSAPPLEPCCPTFVKTCTPTAPTPPPSEQKNLIVTTNQNPIFQKEAPPLPCPCPQNPQETVKICPNQPPQPEIKKCRPILSENKLQVKPCPPIVQNQVKNPCPPIVQNQVKNPCPPIVQTQVKNLCPPIVQNQVKPCPPIVQNQAKPCQPCQPCPPIVQNQVKNCPSPQSQLNRVKNCPPLQSKTNQVKNCPPIQSQMNHRPSQVQSKNCPLPSTGIPITPHKAQYQPNARQVGTKQFQPQQVFSQKQFQPDQGYSQQPAQQQVYYATVSIPTSAVALPQRQQAGAGPPSRQSCPPNQQIICCGKEVVNPQHNLHDSQRHVYPKQANPPVSQSEKMGTRGKEVTNAVPGKQVQQPYQRPQYQSQQYQSQNKITPGTVSSRSIGPYGPGNQVLPAAPYRHQADQASSVQQPMHPSGVAAGIQSYASIEAVNRQSQIASPKLLLPVQPNGIPGANQPKIAQGTSQPPVAPQPQPQPQSQPQPQPQPQLQPQPQPNSAAGTPQQWPAPGITTETVVPHSANGAGRDTLYPQGLECPTPVCPIPKVMTCADVAAAAAAAAKASGAGNSVTRSAVITALRSPGGNFIRIGGLSGFTAVAMGAYAAHVFYEQESESDGNDEQHKKEVFNIANRYHFIHSIALLATPLFRCPLFTGTLLTLGIIVFCGSCYVHALTGNQEVRRATPYGGVLLIAAWLSMLL